MTEAASAAAPNKPGRLFFFGVAFDADPPPGKNGNHFNYAPDNFSDLFTAHSKKLFSEVRVATLKGPAATRNNVVQQLHKLQRVVQKQDLFVLYWGTHGATSKQGWGASLAADTEMYGGELRELLAKFPCPVIAAVSTCGSGGFGRPSAHEPPLPPNVTALCACRRKKSTGNQLDVALCEALSGFADQDESGDVTLQEVLEYLPRRYREWMTVEEGTDHDALPVLAHSDTAPLTLPLAKVADERVAVVQEGYWYAAWRLEKKDGRSRVRFLGYDNTCQDGGYSMPDAALEDDAIDEPGGEPPVEVKAEGAWWPARILSRSADGIRIHYIGYPDSDDDTVKRNRIRFPFCGGGGRPGKKP